ncbi:hypothetical protein CWR48_15365 [Oceanobacillus arenosus]|uniref:Uncharacterized protein n=1 Tax=Oceanobacillus arenosus TaxID=1229153 RepID=A0A3D8PMT6_9BACI|nr:hypothetical protein [Oceanobacillus arenosus]RDW16982.1 hypothetical protein CWR48_15365 [Oceanobacillus arenosus]
MPAISKIRLTNVVYEDGNKRYNDETFLFDGHNGAILLENGGGKTVFIHTVLQAILPHTNLGDRKIKQTLQLENAPAHIGIEWIKNDNPRRYVATCVSLFMTKDGLDSFRYVYEYDGDSHDALDYIPFVRETNGKKRPADRSEIMEYYSAMNSKSLYAQSFPTITGFKEHLEEQHHIISNEWENIVKINRDEGGIDKFFEACRTTTDLYDRLLIPTVEDSIMGHDQGMFVDMFEKQREGFRTYKKLKESILENLRIQEELEKYVAVFGSFSNIQVEYEKAKAHAKGTWMVIQNQRLATEKIAEENLQNNNQWQVDNHIYQLKKESHVILLEEHESNHLESTYKMILAKHEENLEILNGQIKESNSLKHASLKKELKQHEDQLKDYQVDMLAREQDDDLIDYEEKMNEANRALHGYFQGEVERIKKLIEEVMIELRPIVEEHTRLVAHHEKLAKQVSERNIEKAGLEAEIKIKQHRVAALKQEILANPGQEDLKTEFSKWLKRHQFLDEDWIRLRQLDKGKENEITELNAARENLFSVKSESEQALNRVVVEEERLQEMHRNLAVQLAEIRPKWGTIVDLYLRETTIYDELLDMEIGLGKELEDLLYKERLARRFVDDYDEQDSFFGDPFLNQQLIAWKNQVDYVVSGVEYFQGFGIVEKEKNKAYGLWPLTLVTTKKSKQAIIEKLEKVSSSLQFPITVLSLEEAKQIGLVEVQGAWVSPSHWYDVLDQEQFRTWKEEVKSQADIVIENRVKKDSEKRQLQTVIKAFKQFFATYPKERREAITTKLGQLRKQIEDYKQEIKKNMDTQLKLNSEREAIQENIRAYQAEMHGLDIKIGKGNECLTIEKELINHLQSHGQIGDYLEKLEKEARQTSYQLERYQEEMDSKRERKTGLDFELTRIETDDLYLEVKNVLPLFMEDEKSVILNRRVELKFAIRNLQKSNAELLINIENEKSNIARIKTDIVNLVAEASAIDLELEFPPDGEHLLASVRDAIQKLKKEKELLEKETAAAKEKRDGQLARERTLKEQFSKAFTGEDLYRFTEALHEIPRILKEEKVKLAKRENYLNEEKARIDKALTDMKQAANNLNLFEEAHHFKSTTITGRVFTESESSEFSYRRIDYVKEVTNLLRSTKLAVDKGMEDVDHARRHFRDFCNRHISDGKLQHMAIQGMEQKETYEDIISFKNNMMVRIEQADKYARNYISENDKDMQAFINNIHNHLKNLTEQLRIIPKKTKLKIGNDWKEIFKFKVPEWAEEDGKQRIRAHVDWILEQLESDIYLNEQGMDDSGKVRKDIETWLQSKQLLRVVMNNEGMKVNCRKVTNDNQVTTRSYSWEQSNNWSGGEKWSKNMTLFLGILNFVAEKKQHIEGNMKRHRVVILDNPFGKASSEHVLSPVFFIAEQLGFQIIALTAHAEGKFLQDYFPIIYSCRLRATDDPTKKIMSKEKSLHHAYFQDHEPESIERLGEVEQMELF